MTNSEKYTAIVERLKKENTSIEEAHVSAMVISGYLDDLGKAGIIESAFAMTPVGNVVRAICEEFDWKPTDDEIAAFVSEMVGPKEQVPFLFILKKYRDDRNGLLLEFKKMKAKMPESSE